MSERKPHEWKNAWNQYIAVFSANLINVNQGLFQGWLAPALSVLASFDTPLQSGPLTNEQISWIGSTGALGSLVGSIFFAYFISLLGSKQATLLLAIPSIAHWVLIYFGNTYYHIILARFFGAWTSGGSITSVVLFTSEIANDDIRGRLGSVSAFFRNISLLSGYILGATVDYQYIPCICVIIPILFVITFSIQSNTPQYYLQKNKPRKAMCALKHYKGYKGNDELEDDALHYELERLKAIEIQKKADANISFADLCDRETLKGLGFALVLVTICQFTAYYALLTYSVIVFKQSDDSIDPHLGSIIMAIALTLGSLCSTYFADILGRKILNFISLAGSAIGLFVMAIFHYLRINGYDLSAYSWIPVTCLSFTIFIASDGIISLQFICGFENIPPKVRKSRMLILSVFAGIVTFIVLKSFPILIVNIGLHKCLLIHAITSLFGAIFVLRVQRETSGQCIDETITDPKDSQIESHWTLKSPQKQDNDEKIIH